MIGRWEAGSSAAAPRVTLTFGGGPFVGLVTDAAKRPELEALFNGLEAAPSA